MVNGFGNRSRDAQGILGVVYALDRGVKADGQADDGPVLNRILVAMGGDGGGRLLLPPACTVITASTVLIPDNCELVIPTGTTLQLQAGANKDVVRNADQVNGNTNCRITGGGTIDGNRANNTTGTWYGINLKKVTDPVLDVVVKGGRTHGALLDTCTRPKGRIEATDNGTHGVAFSATVHGQLVVQSYDNCRIADPGVGDGVNLSGASTDNTVIAPDCYDSRTAQLSAPGAASAALAGAGAGNLSNGDYAYEITFVTQYGETTAGTASGAVAVVDHTSDGKIALSNIPTDSNGLATARKIYRTAAGGASYGLVATISDNSTTIYTDNVADANLGAAPPAQNTSGKLQGYGVRETVGSSCDRNMVVGGTLVGNLSGTVSLVGTSSLQIDQNVALSGTPTTQAIGDSAALGSAQTGAPLDHKHGMPAFGTGQSVDQAMGDTAADGAQTTVARSDHKHGMPAFGSGKSTDQSIGDTAADGTELTPARSDHKHGLSTTLPASSIDTINLTGGQIAFPATQNPSADANTLDDYEEGTWTPNIGGTTPTYTAQTGYYIKLGKWVWVYCNITVTTVGDGNPAQILGLPFACQNVASNVPIAVGEWHNAAGSFVCVAGYVQYNASLVNLLAATAAASSLAAGANIIGNTTRILFSAWYEAAN